MGEIIKSYTQEMGASRFIGKKYGDEDRVDGGFGKQWETFFANDWFGMLEGLMTDAKAIGDDGDAAIGLMRWKSGEPFQYWVGMFLPTGTHVPEGFGHVDFEPARIGVCWLKGPMNDIFGQEHKCALRLTEDGHDVISDRDGAYWFFERYVSPRFTTPDDKGNVILDICHFIR